jgi:hypothetical protein
MAVAPARIPILVPKAAVVKTSARDLRGIIMRENMTAKVIKVLFINASFFFIPRMVLLGEGYRMQVCPSGEGSFYFSGIFNVSPYILSFCPDGVVVDVYMGDSSKTPNPRPQIKPMLMPWAMRL